MLVSISTFIMKYIVMLRIRDLVDILLVTYIIYKGLQLVSETRAEQLIKGIAILLVIQQLSYWLQLNTIDYLLRNAMQVGIVAVVVVFQPELRRALEQLGRSRVGRMFRFDANPAYDPENVAAEICDSVKFLADNRIGGLIVIEQQTKIGDIIRTGVMLNSIVSAQLLVNIFTPNTPLHDGAVIIRDNQIMAAGCLLPLTSNQSLSYELGTRHRAALGLSETSDSVVIVVSEETGKISIARGGSLTRNLTVDSLNKALMKIMQPDEEDKNLRSKLSLGGWKK